LELQTDQELVYEKGKRSYSLSDLESIESVKSRILPGLLIGTAVGVGGGIALISTVGSNRGSSGDPTGTAIFVSLGGLGLIVLGPVIGALVGYALREGSARIIYPTAVSNSSGNLAPAVGFSGKF